MHFMFRKGWLCQFLAQAQFALGDLYSSGFFGHSDYAQALTWFQKAAEQGHPEAEERLGQLFENGHGTPQDYAQAAKWYLQASEQNEPFAQWRLATLYINGEGVSQDYAQAYFWLDIASVGLEELYPTAIAFDRENCATHLTPKTLAETQERATAWFRAHPR
jgi:uncharacterized protein